MTAVSHLDLVFSLTKSFNRPQTVDFTREKSPHYQATKKLLSFTRKGVFRILKKYHIPGIEILNVKKTIHGRDC